MKDSENPLWDSADAGEQRYSVAPLPASSDSYSLRDRLDILNLLSLYGHLFDGGGVHASIAFTAKIVGFDLGIQLLRRSGLFVAVGLPATAEGNLELNPFGFFFKDPTLIYSAVGNVQEMRELVELAAAGKVKSHIGRTGCLSELPEVFDELEAGKYVGRAVITDLGR